MSVLPSIGEHNTNQISSWIQSGIPIQATGFSKDKQLSARRLGLVPCAVVTIHYMPRVRFGGCRLHGRSPLHRMPYMCAYALARPCRALESGLHGTAVIRTEFICPMTAKFCQSSGDILSPLILCQYRLVYVPVPVPAASSGPPGRPAPLLISFSACRPTTPAIQHDRFSTVRRHRKTLPGPACRRNSWQQRRQATAQPEPATRLLCSPSELGQAGHLSNVQCDEAV